MPKKRKRLTVLLDAGEFAQLGEYCRQRGFKKSTLVARLIRELLEKEGILPQRHLPFSQEGAVPEELEREDRS